MKKKVDALTFSITSLPVSASVDCKTVLQNDVITNKIVY
jgi:hypothetical protein